MNRSQQDIMYDWLVKVMDRYLYSEGSLHGRKLHSSLDDLPTLPYPAKRLGFGAAENVKKRFPNKRSIRFKAFPKVSLSTDFKPRFRRYRSKYYHKQFTALIRDGRQYVRFRLRVTYVYHRHVQTKYHLLEDVCWIKPQFNAADCEIYADDALVERMLIPITLDDVPEPLAKRACQELLHYYMCL